MLAACRTRVPPVRHLRRFTSTTSGQAHLRYLMYVPNVSSITADPRVTYAAGFDFAEFQRFVQNSELNEYQGQIAPKNIAKTPWVHKLDLSVRQEVPFVLGGKIELLADVENVLNLIDKDWGTIRQVAFPYLAPVVNVACSNAACNQYVYSNRVGNTFAAPTIPTNINRVAVGRSLRGVRVKF